MDQICRELQLYSQCVDGSADFYDDLVSGYCGGVTAPNAPAVVCTDTDFKFIRIGTVDRGDPEGRNIEVTREPFLRNVRKNARAH